MPLSDIQSRILKTVAANRSPDSYLAGATVFHRSEGSPRFSEDLDFFHDLEDSVAQSAETDAATLRQAGYDLKWLLRTSTFYRAIVSVSTETLKLEQIGRHACYTQENINRLNLRAPLDIKMLKQRWLVALEEAKRLVGLLPEQDIGCLYLLPDRTAVTPDPAAHGFTGLNRHFGSVRGAWPTVTPYRNGTP